MSTWNVRARTHAQDELVGLHVGEIDSSYRSSDHKIYIPHRYHSYNPLSHSSHGYHRGHEIKRRADASFPIPLNHSLTKLHPIPTASPRSSLSRPLRSTSSPVRIKSTDIRARACIPR
jgi:hypothetical protein